jgi:hypothetical protein
VSELVGAAALRAKALKLFKSKPKTSKIGNYWAGEGALRQESASARHIRMTHLAPLSVLKCERTERGGGNGVDQSPRRDIFAGSHRSTIPLI